jgi:hypothetical protein
MRTFAHIRADFGLINIFFPLKLPSQEVQESQKQPR